MSGKCSTLPSQGLVTFETFDQSDDETWPDQHFDNFVDNFDNFLTIVNNFNNFPARAAAPRPAVQRGQHENFVFLVCSHDGNK